MDLAERLHKTLAELLANADSRELGLWMARDIQKAKEQQLKDLVTRAEGARRR